MDALDERRLAALRNRLIELRLELRHLVGASKAGAETVGLDEPIGRIARMDAMQQQKMIAANRLAAQRRLQQVQAALDRMDAGEYGECRACGEPIGSGRLEAHPEAPLCLGCQGQREAR